MLGLDLKSKDEKIQAQIKELKTLISMHSELNTQWNLMDASDIEFHVSDQSASTKGAGGETTYNSNRVDIKIGSDKGNSSTMAHEFRHGYSYLIGELMDGGMLYDITDEIAAFNAGYLFLDRNTTKLVVDGFYNLEWFKGGPLKTELYQHLTGKEGSLTTNTLASTVIKYNPNARISFLLGINKNNANYTLKVAMEVLNKYSNSKKLEFRYENLLKNR